MICDASRQGRYGRPWTRRKLESLPAPDSRGSEAAKRRQIIDGARRVFLAQGFDAASMGEIAREAGVSKGTLYVYFKSKEELFEAIVEEQCRPAGRADLHPRCQ